MANVTFTIPGTPPGKPRMTQRDKWKQRPVVMAYRAWCDQVREIVGNQVPPAVWVTMLSITAYFEPPKSWTTRRWAAALDGPHRSRPDADNVAKSCMDALWKEDSGIATLLVNKRWGREARLEIEIIYAGGE